MSAGVRRFHISCLPRFLFTSFDGFLRHPLSNLTSTFLDFEGACSGGYVHAMPVMPPVSSLSIHLDASCSSQVPLPLPFDIVQTFRVAPHIHADASQDAWNRGVVRSDTDYSVYSAPRAREVPQGLAGNDTIASVTVHGYQGTGGSMQGADVASYRSRSRYHTTDDTIRGMGDDGARGLSGR